MKQMVGVIAAFNKNNMWADHISQLLFLETLVFVEVWADHISQLLFLDTLVC
jgi:hypothetical protein